EISCWIAYGQAKQLSKEREKFGSGCIEGVIAPESANNAKEGAALLTTLAFGIPGSSAMAILLGGFVIVGVTPGPDMMTTRLPLSFTLMLGIAFANIVGGLLCLVSTRYMVRVATIHIDFLFSAIVAIAFVAAYTVRGDPRVLIIVILATILGLCMKRFGYSRPAFLLGFVLGVLFEQRFFHAFYLHGPFFFVTPISLSIIAIIVILLAYPYLQKTYAQRFKGGTKPG
ncbi:MAG: tripartite tricarboxylate transporter permease, partial [Chloroflexota bacterium]